MATPNSQAPPPLSAARVDMPLAAVNRLLAGVHAALAAAAIAHRALLLLSGAGAGAPRHAHAAMLAADLALLFLWVLSQAPMWRPVSRAAFPARLRRRELPAVDVMVVTADPEKEPTAEVMDTVVSAMALDYPGGRLAVYVSDDAGSPATLQAAREAYAFARAWVPFCRSYSVQCPCPRRYFAGDDQHGAGAGDRQELAAERLRVKKMYEAFKEGVEEAMKKNTNWTKASRQDHDAYIEIIGDGDVVGAGSDGNHPDGDGDGDEETMMPSLVYVSREKRRASPHHFKAGALNALLRVSGLMSNSPYVLVLDCDMSCNTRSSAMEAMCFHLDDQRRGMPTLAFVQFPQMFHNLSANDIYAGELRSIFSTRWKGMDGLRGPILSGTGFYARRDALYGATPATATSPSAGASPFCSTEAGELERTFGRSGDLVASVRDLHRSRSPTAVTAARRGGGVLPRDGELVASCAFEDGTRWGDAAGFLYQSVVEDYFTGFRQLFCRGWTSAYCHPPPASRPPFLGSVPTNLNDALVQQKRWMSGLLAVALSRHCPLLAGDALAASVLQAMSYAYYAFAAAYALPALCYAAVPQLCFLRGVAVFPAAGTPWLAVFAAALASSAAQHLVEASVAKRRVAARTWWNEQRFWMLNAVTGQLFACVTVGLELAGAGTVDFELTSKAADGRLYREGVFDFTGCSTLLLPATALSVLNAAALAGGTWRMIRGGLSGELFAQFFLLCYVAAFSYPLLEGMFIRKDAARVPARITALSVALAGVVLSLFW
ncbi:hypothetical protein ACP4OV_019368 [Aristida adscensionis]